MPLAALGLDGACLSYDSSVCPSGYICPEGTQCMDVPGSTISLCLLDEPTKCRPQDVVECPTGMACDTDEGRTGLCVSLAQVTACVGKEEGVQCVLPGFSPLMPFECREGVCIGPVCGDGQVSGDEKCDATDLNGATCATFGRLAGEVTCTSDCTLDASGCGEPDAIQAGTFLMGSPTWELGREDDEGVHEVTLTRSFVLQETEVTQAQFESLMGYNPSLYQDCGSTCPVESVTWHEVAAYMNALSQAGGFASCYECTTPPVGYEAEVYCWTRSEFATPYDCPGYRMPTEAEWEVAARAGDPRATYNGDLTLIECEQPNDVLDPIAWFCGNSDDDPHPVSKLVPNHWGLHDMLGNVWEWCHDGYADYPDTSVPDPVGASVEGYQVVRGGGWGSGARYARASKRMKRKPIESSANIGARAARTILP